MTNVFDASTSWVRAARQASESLVHVSASCRRGATGAVYTDEGLVLTTARAVASAAEVEVALGEQTAKARLVGFDAATDIGVLQLEQSLGKAPAWVTAPPELGTALLFGSRPGRAPRVRLGLVSQLGDAWHTPRGGRVERYLETDLAPEPGFSGGLAFDHEGRAVGLSAAGLLRGVPLLLERATLERVVSAITQHGRVRRGYLGVGTQAVQLPDAAGQGVGLLVSSVQPDSAAANAGVLLGDVLLRLGSSPLTDSAALRAALEDSEGQELELSLWRAGSALLLKVTPGVRS
jgi:S1-C subfamily serine protease